MEENFSQNSKFGLRSIFSRSNLLFLLLFLIFLNLLYLDYMILQKPGANLSENTQAPSQSINDNSFCSQSCVDKINSVRNLITNLTPTIALTPIPTPKAVQNTSLSTPSNPKDYYVPFGSGSGNSSDWQNVAGVSAYVDSTAYSNIKTVFFEVSLHIPTGNETASVRLYNATDGREIAGSQLDFNGNTSSVLLSSQSINLDYGNKLYVVQMKTQLSYQAILDQARVHISTK
jgi:hypothetical protein